MRFSFLDLFDISEVEIELINPTSPEKLIEIGRIGGMTSGKTVIDFGCGYAEPLVLWAEALASRVSGLSCVQRWSAAPVRRSPGVGFRSTANH